jgi:predicted aspartyl protease
MTGVRLWLVWLLLPLVSACSSSPVNCDLVQVAKMPLEVHNRLLVVPAGIGGKWVTLLVDTGAERTVLSNEAVARLGLERDKKIVTHSSGMGGAFTSNDAIIPGLVLGGVRMPVQRVAVGEFRFGPGLTADGLLGSDVLLAFDLDIDVPDRTLTLYRPRVCPDGVQPPWSEPFARVPGVRSLRDRLLIPLDLDGVTGMGILDTGAQATTIGVSMAKRLGLTPELMASDPIVQHHGAGPGSQEARLHRFSLLQIGPASAPDPVLSVLPVDAGVGDALVGEDFIDGRRIWLSFANREVFIATSRTAAVP